MRPPRRRPGAPGQRAPRRERSDPRSPRSPGRARRRPGQRTSGSGPVRGSGPRRAPGGLTGRAAVLGLVVCALVLSLAYPLKQYIAQRGEISRLEQEQADVRARVDALEAHRGQLADPAYIRTQARQRLQYVMPGDTLYVVVDPGSKRPDHGATPRAGEDLDAHLPWYGQLWDSVQVADAGG